MTGYDASEGECRRDEAIERVGRNAEPGWRGAARAAVRWWAARRQEFTPDDVWKVLDRAGWERPREPRALGNVMQACAREGVCVATGRTLPCTRPERHCGTARVWRSLVVGQNEPWPPSPADPAATPPPAAPLQPALFGPAS